MKVSISIPVRCLSIDHVFYPLYGLTGSICIFKLIFDCVDFSFDSRSLCYTFDFEKSNNRTGQRHTTMKTGQAG